MYRSNIRDHHAVPVIEEATQEQWPIQVLNSASQEPHAIPVNGEPIKVSNRLFDGQVCLIHRPIDGGPFRYSEVLAGARRRCEFQLQCQFKEPPQGTLWLGGEIFGPLSLNFFTRQIVVLLLKMMRQIVGPSIQYSTGIDDPTSKVGYIHYPALEVFSVLLATRKGDRPPALGSRDLSQTNNLTRASRLAFEELLRGPMCKDYIFTFTLKSMYLDLFTWDLVNLPGVPPISLETFWGSKRAVRVMVYNGGPQGPNSAGPQERFLDLLVTSRTDEAEDTDDCGEHAEDFPASIKGQVDDCETASFFSCEEDIALTPRTAKGAAHLFSNWLFGPNGCLTAIVCKVCSGSLTGDR